MIKKTFRQFRALLHPMVILIVAQISWGLLMFVLIRWYVINGRQVERLMDEIPRDRLLWSSSWLVLALVCVLMAIILVGLYVLFVNLSRQIRLGKMQNTILDSVTHELKTPLASIRLSTETVMMRDLDREQKKRFLGRIITEVERLRKLIEEILVMARLQGKVKFDKSSADIVEIIEDSWSNVCERIGSARNFEYQKNVEDKKFPIMCNDQQMIILFDNLFDNAVKYTTEGGRITLNLKITKLRIYIKISDNGCGIGKQDLRRIFHKFYRSRATAKSRVSGCGLGLFVCNSVVRAHQGRIFGESPGEGRGATFYVEFERDDFSD